MAADDKAPTGRDLDKALELEEARLSERVRMRLDSHEDEDSTVIEQRAAAQVNSVSSIPPRGKLLLAILDRLSPVGRVVILALMLLIVGGLVYVSGAAGAIVGAFK